MKRNCLKIIKGLQRFGIGSPHTHEIGKDILKLRYESAVEKILRPKEGEHQLSNQSRKYFQETKDIAGTLKNLPRQLHVEKYLLQGLQKYGISNHLAALMCIPRGMRFMYVHAYQSYVWNSVTSFRIRMSRTSVLAGDLVVIEERRLQNRSKQSQQQQSQQQQSQQQAKDEQEVEDVAVDDEVDEVEQDIVVKVVEPNEVDKYKILSRISVLMHFPFQLFWNCYNSTITSW